VSWDGTWRRLWLPVKLSHHWLHSLSSLSQVVVRNLWEQVMHHMGTNIMLDLVENSIVAVNGGKTTSHVVPLIPAVPGYFLFWVGRTVVVEVGNNIKPDDEHPVWDKVCVEKGHGANSIACSSANGEPCDLECVGGLDERAFIAGEEVTVGVVMRSSLTWGAGPQVERVGKERERKEKTTKLGNKAHVLVQVLSCWVPRLVILNVTMVGMMCAMRDSPAMVWNHDAAVYNVTDKIVEGLVI